MLRKVFLYTYVHVREKDYRRMTSGWRRAPYFRSYGRGLVSKPAISLKKSWGGGGGYRRMTL